MGRKIRDGPSEWEERTAAAPHFLSVNEDLGTDDFEQLSDKVSVIDPLDRINNKLLAHTDILSIQIRFVVTHS